MDKYRTFIDRLQQRVAQQPERTAFTFLQDGETETESLSYQHLETKAKAIATVLQTYNCQGERALLLYQPGLEFITAFLGCLYAGVVAVPAYPPRANRSLDRLLAIVTDADAKFALTTQDLQDKIEDKFQEEGHRGRETEGKRLQFIATDIIQDSLAHNWFKTELTSEDLAFLQYTSGSTGVPKGVMVSHGNLLANSIAINNCFQNIPEDNAVSWLPPYHDMGLIGCIIQPMYVGLSMYLMPPVSFLQRPYRWLQAISQYGANTSGGPNFAYDLCVSQISEEQRDSLDLSCWELAFSGAEPVRAETIKRFSDYFASCGFRQKVFYPCYGMAESTLIITGGSKQVEPVFRDFDQAGIEENKAVSLSSIASHTSRGDNLGISLLEENQPEGVTLVGCGHNLEGQSLAIVNPDTLQQCQDGEIGEIWCASESVAQGYWNRKELTEYAFGATLPDFPDVTFLRTGDLGFLADGELFVTGRLKDLIIIRGRNYYPQDIELTVDNAHDAIRPGAVAAFAVDRGGEEKLAIAAEVKRTHLRKLNTEEVVKAVRKAVLNGHDLNPYAIVLLKTGSIPKTSSGKIQRHACKAGFLDNSLVAVNSYQLSVIRHSSLVIPHQSSVNGHNSPLQDWLVNNIAQRLGVSLTEIDITEPFATLGLDSIQAVRLSADLEDYLRLKLSPTLIYDYPNIASLAAYLSGLQQPQVITPSLNVPKINSQAQIAIVGMGCRFPGANNPDQFWQLLRDGKDAIRKSDRWEGDDYGGFIEDVDKFDPQFFGISPRETQRMDPQQRLLLEVSWSALENAAIAPETLSNSATGVFVGISSSDYSQLQLHYGTELDAYAGTGNAHSIAANRLSYTLDLRGPSMTVDTACSSSLVAVHLACQSLRNGECHTAIVGGVNLMLSPELTQTFSLAGMMAQDGRCKTFDAEADGYVRGEGCGVIILKRLDDALRDGDNVLAVVKGSAINQDGRSNGLTAPNSLAQQAVIQQALANAGVTPEEISYIEAHGTGTKLGDPIEVNSLKNILTKSTTCVASCYVSSVKTNIGHLEAAAGIAGLIKTVLCLQQETIPPHLNFKSLNPHIDFSGTPLTIPTTLQDWKREDKPRIAGISSFGFGGTNAHVILGDMERRGDGENRRRGDLETGRRGDLEKEELSRPLHVLNISGKNESALQDLVREYHNYLQTHPDVSLADICFTANTGRSHFKHRLTVIADSTSQLQEKLTGLLTGEKVPGTISKVINKQNQSRIAFLFTGQGSQYEGMGYQLYQTQPTFRQTLDNCAAILQALLGLNLIEIIYPTVTTNTIDQTQYTQPAIFALEYALAQMWISWGIKPDVVMGHSVGEYVAATIAGVFSLEDGLKLIAQRGKLMQALPDNGGMFAVFADEETVSQVIADYTDKITIAAVNGIQNIVISGDNDALSQIISKLESQGINSKQLTVSHAFHSPLMQPVLSEFAKVAESVNYSLPHTSLISNVTGEVATVEIATPQYWTNHIIAPVKFAQGMQCLQAGKYNIFLEVGAKPILLGMGRSILETDKESQSYLCLPSLRPRKSDWSQVIKSLATLYSEGVKIDWFGFDRDYSREKLQLPTYPFQRQSYWLERNVGVSNSNSLKVLSRKVGSEGKQKLARYQVAWRNSDIDLDSLTPQFTGVGKWLILGDEGGLGEDITSKLREYGQDYLLVYPSEVVVNQRENIVVIDYSDLDDWSRVISYQEKLQGIIYLGSLDSLEFDSLTTIEIEDYQKRNCIAILHLIQTLFKQSVTAPLWIVTRATQCFENEQETVGREASILSNSLWGLGKVIASEHPEYYGGIIDLNSDIEVGETEKILAVISNFSREDYLAVRRNKIYLPRLFKTETINHQPLKINPAGYYLITGGLGSLGLQVAELLVNKGAKYLLLVGRSKPSQSAQKKITELENKSATVEIVEADISNLETVRNIIDKYSRSPLIKGSRSPLTPRVVGVIHAAGILDDALLQNQTWEKFQKVLKPKVIGAWNLHQCTQEIDLDFFVLFSSIASLIGSPGQGNYAAANACLDAIALYRKSIGLPGLSINWGAWDSSGMAIKQGFNRQGLELINPEEGLKTLEELLTTDIPQVGVFNADWNKLSKQFPYLSQVNYFAELLTVTTEEEVRKENKIYNQLLTLASEEREVYLKDYLKNAIATILQIDKENLSVRESLFDLGMDSLMLMEAINQLKDDLQLMLYPREFYERPRIDSLAKYLATEFTNSFDTQELSLNSKTVNSQPLSIGSKKKRNSNQQQQIKLDKPIAFILSSPRSGSTLLRVMLAGHPDIASPPELHLLPFANMEERQQELNVSYLGEGLQRAFMELKQIDAEASQELVANLVKNNLSVAEVYQMLQQLAGERLLIDKSPTYGNDKETLDQAEIIFSNAKYIHLVRHPYAVIESFARMRMDKLISSGNSNPYQLAESIWSQSNQNILDFAEEIDSHKLLLVRYEQLVSQPETVMREVCNFLEIPFHEAVLTPYQGNRMTDGVSNKSLAIGDPNFLTRKQIDPKMAENWREITLPSLLSLPSQDISKKLHYQLPQEGEITDHIEHKMEEILVNIRGLRVCLCTWGPKEGPIILCLHGILEQGAAWSEVAIRLAQKGYRVIAPDLRGHGKSDRVGKGGSYNLMDFLGDIDAIVEVLAGKAFTLVGHSLGSVVAAIFASVRPQLVKNLVLIETILPSEPAEEETAQQLATHLDYLASPPEHPVFPDIQAAADRLRQATPAISKSLAKMLAERITEPCEGGVRWRWEPLLRTRAGMGFNGIGRSRYLGLLKRISAPITLVYGDKSNFNRTEDLKEQQAAMPNAKRVVLSGGHNLPLESPSGIAKIISSAIALTTKLIP